jgi:DNA-binding LytR/AlgR family response regulator
MADGRTLFAAQRLSALEGELPNRSFVRISRQSIANLDRARTIRPSSSAAASCLALQMAQRSW